MQSSRSDTSEASLLSRVEAAVTRGLRVTGAGLAGGIIAGAVVGGLGSRLMMRIVGVMARSHYGEVTHANAVVGETTLGGTISLVIQGAVFGLFGGIMYLLVRWWMPGRGWRKGLVFGLFLLAFQGTVVLDGNYEYYRYVPAWLSFLLFAALFPGYGVVTAGVAEALAGSPRRPPNRRVTQIGYAVVGLIALVATVDLVRQLRELLAGGA